MEKHAYMAWLASTLAEALLTTAMGLFVAVPAVWWHNYLLSRMELFESEMSNAAREAVTYLNTHREWRNQPENSATGASLVFSVTHVPPYSEVSYDRQRALLLAMWLAALFIAFIFARGMYWSYAWW